jgi:hypothetical protein
MLHTALNIALFPPLFFFSGLFYTDVLSTCVVLRTYRLYLEREGAYKHSANGLLWLFPTGIIALTMRQTNIFWVAVFLGALEAIRTIKSDAADVDVKGDVPGTWQQTVAAKFKQYSRGKIHDPIIRDAGLEGKRSLGKSLSILANNVRFYPVCYQYRSRCIIPPPSPCGTALALYTAHHLIRLLSILERRCRSWYVFIFQKLIINLSIHPRSPLPLNYSPSNSRHR